MNIYLPTDFSECSFRACEYALAAFTANNNFTLLHAIDTPHSGATLLISLDEELIDIAEEKMKEMTDRLKVRYPDHKFKSLVLFGSLNQVVGSLDKDHIPDFIVMGTTGATGIQKLFGSNTSSVIRYAQCPVICVPSATEIKPARKVMFASDFKNTVDKDNRETDKLHKLVRFIKEANADLSILHVSGSDRSRIELDTEYPELKVFTNSGIAYELVFVANKNNQHLEEIIVEQAHKAQYDVIATIPHHADFPQNIFHRSISKKLTLHTDMPLLVVK